MEESAAEHEIGAIGDVLLSSHEETSLPTLIGSSLNSANGNLSPTQEGFDNAIATGLLTVSTAACAG